ncbi:hypothetical protein BZM26_36595 [Paraburkholderia strydomiana]|nr:hypothetical protein BZM26_36595 [Paraburkholderia strydomiana]
MELFPAHQQFLAVTAFGAKDLGGIHEVHFRYDAGDRDLVNLRCYLKVTLTQVSSLKTWKFGFLLEMNLLSRTSGRRRDDEPRPRYARVRQPTYRIHLT